MLGTESRHSSSGSIGRPLNDRETDTRINRFNTAHPPNIEEEVSRPNTAKRQRSIDPEVSGMS